ncbi:MAG: hypothetical protein HY881_14880 [Deltaproteobacteria bacterium]|nr:hypothetical protein [Deltaproteobacteria bacterium]
MIENNKQNDRKEILKLITIGVCLLELLIAICTFFYQQDTQSRTEIPISEEMARVYIDHPEKLKDNERLGVNRHAANQNAYVLITNDIVRHAFPWKGWILLSIGAPITLAFLIVLVAKAYCQVAEFDEKESEDVENKWVKGLNTLNKINITWLMLILIGGVFALWYIPEVVKFAGNVTAEWLTKFWWIPVTICILVFLIAAFWFFLQYRLKLKAMQMNMEVEKLKYLQGGDAKTILTIGNSGSNAIPLIEDNLEKGKCPQREDLA